MRPLRGVCVGAGYFSQFHFDAWSRIPDVEILAICDLDLSQAEAACAKWKIPQAMPSLLQFFDTSIDGEQIDFIDIITPPATHRELVDAAAARGVAILCQKPLAPNFDEAVDIVELAGRYNARLMVHDNWRFQPWYRQIKRMLDSGVVGDKLHSLSMRTRMGDGWSDDAYLARQPYFREYPQLLVYETGVHFIDTFRYLAGEVRQVTAALRRLNSHIQGEDSGMVLFEFESGAIGMWDANRYNEPNYENPRFTFGELLVDACGGSIRLSPDGRLHSQKLGAPEQPVDYKFSEQGFAGDSLYGTFLHFVNELRGDKNFETSGLEYLKTLAVQEAIYRSAATGQTVSLES